MTQTDTFPRHEEDIVHREDNGDTLLVVRETAGTSLMVDIHTKQSDGEWGAPNPADGGTRHLAKPSMLLEMRRNP
jgi:hypothetical protein